MGEHKRAPLSPSEEDAYITGWGFAGLITTIGLCKLIGVVALVLAGGVAVIAAWKLTRSKRRLSKRVWWYCWFALLLSGLGLAIYETQTMSVPLPVLGKDGILR